MIVLTNAKCSVHANLAEVVSCVQGWEEAEQAKKNSIQDIYLSKKDHE